MKFDVEITANRSLNKHIRAPNLAEALERALALLRRNINADECSEGEGISLNITRTDYDSDDDDEDLDND